MRGNIALLGLGVLLLAACASHSTVPKNCQPMECFAYQLREAIDNARFYPAEAVMEGARGKVTVSFYYTGGGKAHDITVAHSSGDVYLDAAAMIAVQKASLPLKPPELEGQDHFSVILNYQ